MALAVYATFRLADDVDLEYVRRYWPERSIHIGTDDLDCGKWSQTDAILTSIEIK